LAKSEFLRLVVVEGCVTPDPEGRTPGRGAHLHPDLGCLDLAVRRRAFPRAFRLPGPLDASVLRDYLEASSTRRTVGDTSNTSSNSTASSN
jgi:uncharacterized protein